MLHYGGQNTVGNTSGMVIINLGIASILFDSTLLFIQMNTVLVS